MRAYNVSVIIPTFYRDSYLANTLRDLLKQRNSFNFEIIVVDQNPVLVQSRNESLYLLGKKENIKWLSCVGKGVVYARNLAISVADGELLVFVDDDVQIHDENFLNKHIKAHAESGPNVVAVCGRENNPGSEASLAKKLNYKRGHPIYDVLFFPRNYEKRIEAAVLSTCNCSVKKETMLELGCFDENFSGASYGDDSDLALRLIQKGYKIVYDPSPALIHLIAPMGGLRLSTSNRIKSFSSSEKVVSSIVFYLKHIHRNHRKLRFYYIYNYILRKSLFLRANVHKPWILPKVFLSLVWTFPKVKRSLGQGHKFSFKK